MIMPILPLGMHVMALGLQGRLSWRSFRAGGIAHLSVRHDFCFAVPVNARSVHLRQPSVQGLGFRVMLLLSADAAWRGV